MNGGRKYKGLHYGMIYIFLFLVVVLYFDVNDKINGAQVVEIIGYFVFLIMSFMGSNFGTHWAKNRPDQKVKKPPTIETIK